MASEGNSTVHHATCRLVRLSATWAPQSGEPTSAPSPRNDSVAMENTASASRTVPSTAMGPPTLGSTSRVATYQPRSPRRRAAAT